MGQRTNRSRKPAALVTKRVSHKRRGLKTSPGTVNLGGRVLFSAQVVIPEQGESVSGFRLELAPFVGLFVAEGLGINLAVAVGAGFGDLFEKTTKTVGFGLGIRYLFGDRLVRPFMSLALGGEFLIPDEGDDLTFLLLSPAIGVVVGVGEHAGLSFGVAGGFNIGVGDTNATIVTVPISLLSLEVFI
jgi:hypothetical protein